MKPSDVKTKHLVLLGAGHAHLVFLKRLGMDPIPGLKVTLLNPDRCALYSGLLPGVIGGHFSTDDMQINLGPLCQFAGADFMVGAAVNVDAASQQVFFNDRPGITYDLLSVNVGSASKSLERFGNGIPPIPVKPIRGFMEHAAGFDAAYRRGEAVAVVGGGAAGIELALALKHRLGAMQKATPASEARFYLCFEGHEVLPESGSGVRRRLIQALAKSGIELVPQFMAERYGDGRLISGTGRELEVGAVVCALGAEPQSWLSSTALKVTEAGYLAVTDRLQSISHKNVFAVGDCADVEGQARAKAGVYSVRQGAALFENLSALMSGRPLQSFRAQRSFLSLISLGGETALGYRRGLRLSNRWMWRLKRWIDFRFLDGLKQFPAMSGNPSQHDLSGLNPDMQCRGCGAKVASSILTEVLAELDPAGELVLDDSAVVVPPKDQVLIQSVDAFRPIIDDPYLHARIAVVHAASDVYAMAGSLGPVLVNLTLPYASENVTRCSLKQVMSGALEQIKLEGGQLVGGHTSEGLELNIGLSVSGWADRSRIQRAQGARVGDQLILTKGLGTGTLFAAEMRGLTQADWIDAAVASMLLSNRAGVPTLTCDGVHAVTDVTGFGLAAHLKEMLDGPGLSATLWLDQIPVLPGAFNTLAEQGIVSTAHENNRRAAGVVLLRQSPDDRVWGQSELLFDPQTSGGLLIASAPERVAEHLTALRSAGYDAARIIGEVHEGAGEIECLATRHPA